MIIEELYDLDGNTFCFTKYKISTNETEIIINSKKTK